MSKNSRKYKDQIKAKEWEKLLTPKLGDPVVLRVDRNTINLQTGEPLVIPKGSAMLFRNMVCDISPAEVYSVEFFDGYGLTISIEQFWRQEIEKLIVLQGASP